MAQWSSPPSRTRKTKLGEIICKENTPGLSDIAKAMASPEEIIDPVKVKNKEKLASCAETEYCDFGDVSE
jgi:hypothetical protein